MGIVMMPSRLRYHISTSFMNMVQDTAISKRAIIIICIAALVGGGIAFVIDKSIQDNRLSRIPLVFSEVGQTKRLYAQQNIAIPTTTLYYGVVNDIAMKVFEANNLAYKRGFNNRSFAQELEFKMDRSFKEHHLIKEYADEFPVIVQNALASVSNIVTAATDIDPAIQTMNTVWDENHHDVYHTEYYTVTVSDADGKSHTEMRSREVYDYTIHTYEFNRGNAATAKTHLDMFFTKHENVFVEALKPIIMQTGAENEDAISRTQRDDNKMVSSDDAKVIVQNNYLNSNLSQNIKHITNLHSYIKREVPEYTSAIATAKSIYKYQTYSHSDQGPKEYQTMYGVLNHTIEMRGYINEIVVPMKESNALVQGITEGIKAYIAVTLDGKEGDPDTLRDKIMGDAKILYMHNYKAGFTIETFSYAERILIILFGMILAGFAAGFIMAYIENRRGLPNATF